MYNNVIIDYDKKNAEDYKKLAELLYFYHSGMPMKDSDLNIIAQATQAQRVQAMNLTKMQSIGITSSYGSMSDPLEYSEKLGEALVTLYYSQRDITKEQLMLIATATDEEKLEALESYTREHYARPESAIRTMALENEERKVAKSR